MLLIAALLLQIYSDSYFAALLLILAAGLPVLSLLLSLPAMRGLQLRVEASRASVSRKEEAQWEIVAENRSRLPLAKIVLRFQMENQLTGAFCPLRLRFSGASAPRGFLLRADTAHCGRLYCHLKKAKVYDCLGLFSMRRRLEAGAAMLVCPVATQADSLPQLEKAVEQGTVLKARPGGGSGEDYDLRLYHPGDPVRLIHWKLSSKRDALIFREILEKSQPVPALMFDHFGTPEEMDQVLDRLYGISSVLLERQQTHLVRWMHPITGLVREYCVDSPREWERCLAAILADPAPQTAKSVPSCTQEVARPGEIPIYLTPGREDGL